MSRLCRHRVRAWLAVVTAPGLLALGGCGRGGSAGAGDPPYAAMGRGLCRALERARAGDAEGARRAFFDTAHGPLHQLAAAAAERDRAAAARLLEAKQPVEQRLAGGPPEGPPLPAELQTLVAAAGNALAAIGQRRVRCGRSP